MALDFSSMFDDEEKEGQQKIVRPSSTLNTIQAKTEPKKLGLDFSSMFDDDNKVQQQEKETRVDIFRRTGKVPEGFEARPTVPTGADDDEGIEIVNLEQEQKKIEEQKQFQRGEFELETTKMLREGFYGEDSSAFAPLTTGAADIFGLKEKSREYVPEVLQPLSDAVTQLSNDVIAGLVYTAVAGGETVTESAEALTRVIHDTFDEDNKLFGKTGKELIPFTPEKSGEKLGQDLLDILAVSEAIPVVGTNVAATRATVNKVIREARADAKRAEAIANKKMRINRAKNATDEVIASRQAEADKVADANTALKTELISEFEAATGKTISKEVDGVKVLDDEAARQAGRETAREIQFTERERLKGDAFVTGKDVKVADDDTSKMLFEMQMADDEIISPILKSEKLNGLVAATAELKRLKPAAFRKRFHTNPDGTQGKEYSVIDHLLDLTIRGDLEDQLGGDELIDVLNKYNLSFEDYILAVVGSGSEAGKVLNKLSQIKRTRPLNEMQQLQRAATEAQQGQIRNTIMRIEGIRRGGLVSQIATAARNLTSAGIRAPLESLGDVMDTAIYNAGLEKGVVNKGVAGAKALVSKENWSGSFNNMRYMFGPDAKIDAAEYVDFILQRPELAKQFDLMFNQLNELQQATGRGLPRQRQIEKYIQLAKEDARKSGKRLNKRQLQREAEEYADRGIFGIEFGKEFTKEFNTLGKAGDFILSEMEDAVSVLNTANRWQEYLIRRGAFLGQLERLTKREYGIDLIDALNDGKLVDLLNDASSVRPKDARSFKDLISDSVDRALDITYAKQPEMQPFREITSFITRNGLTVAIAFPRFMFNSLELLGNYAGGASIPLTKKIIGAMPDGPLSAKDRQRITRNIVGLAAVGAAYQIRSQPDAPADYKELPVGDGTVIDTTPQFPVRQLLYIGDSIKHLKDGTFYSDFWNPKEAAETFFGTDIRVGVGSSIIDETANLLGGTDLTKDEAGGRAAGRLLGNYLSTWGVPYGQIIDTERALGIRPEEQKETAVDPVLDGYIAFEQNLARSLKRYSLTPAEEDALPKRERLFQEEAARKGSAYKVTLGLSMRSRDNEYGEYLKRMGLSEFQLGSTSKVQSIRNFVNKELRDLIPGIVEAAQAYEKDLRRDYKNSKSLQKEMSEQRYVNSMIKPLVTQQIKAAKSNLSGDGETINPNADEYVAAMIAYRRLPKDLRGGAASEFIKREGRPPDGSKTEDLQMLFEMGIALKEAYK